MSLKSVTCYDCLGARVHVVARCPKCFTGTLMATADRAFCGILQEQCSDCNENTAFYVLVPEHKAWLLAEPVEMKVGNEGKDAKDNKQKEPVPPKKWHKLD
ncbi:MAG: hypothetical protein U1D67_09205 [Dehalococcoidia bacterium]|nr:hypothetical protein [Dehalococcoidia bacterium]MDZ4247281.1 hypothetical protein [Dehalococcoidia bacterium]